MTSVGDILVHNIRTYRLRNAIRWKRVMICSSLCNSWHLEWLPWVSDQSGFWGTADVTYSCTSYSLRLQVQAIVETVKIQSKCVRREGIKLHVICDLTISLIHAINMYLFYQNPKYMANPIRLRSYFVSCQDSLLSFSLTLRLALTLSSSNATADNSV